MERREMKQLFAFDRWANRETLGALRTLTDEPSDELGHLLRHTLSATDNWLSSVNDTEPSGQDEPHSLDAIATYLEHIEARTTAFVKAVSDARLRDGFELRNPARVRFPIVVGDVMQHVILHGVEHRAQIMYEVGERGGQPVELQYVQFISERPDDV